jgi:56kDa selenium binding protein (SBP56)
LGDHLFGTDLEIWLTSHEANNEWQAKEVGTIGDLAKIPMPVDASISADAKTLWVNTFMDGTTHLFDISDPTKPVQIYKKVTGKQVNMISQSWDGKRVYTPRCSRTGTRRAPTTSRSCALTTGTARICSSNSRSISSPKSSAARII